MIIADDRDDEFLIAACQAMRADTGPDALDELGWWDLLPEMSDPDARSAVVAVSRAQGRELADSPAIGGVLAQPFVERLGMTPGSVVAAIARDTADGRRVRVLVGDTGDRSVLFDVPGQGVHVVDPAELASIAVDVPGRLTVREVDVDLATRRPALPEAAAAGVRASALYRARVATAAEMLGAAETALATAVEYASIREQFGRPIGGFQAVRHLLAWASTDCKALDSVIRRGIDLLEDPPGHFGEVVKALAGRNGRRACERSLQVLGGIGFTAEHTHHHHHSRVLLLDALLGSSGELSHDLGRWLRTTGADPSFPAAVVAGAAR